MGTRSNDTLDAAVLLSEERAGLLLHLPVPLGTTVWKVRANPACHQGVWSVEKLLFGKVTTPRLILEAVPFAVTMLDAWGNTVFSTEAEGKEIIDRDRTGSGPIGHQVPE